jgi:2-keto-4-pentenoate hydratase/2-oxohepta-3-ene-1,7-dioic acid hydratase in catechol pathway
MNMRLVNILMHGHAHLGVHFPDGILPVTEMAALFGLGSRLPRTLDDVFADPASLMRLRDRLEHHPERVHAKLQPLSSVRILPAVPHPGKIICVGRNYGKHARETGNEIPGEPILFNKFSDTVAAHEEDVPIPQGVTTLDYEGELAVVIGRHAHRVAREDALDYVLGYTVANDVSARELQNRTSQWLLGKSCPKFAPLGSDLVTVDEVPDPGRLHIRTYLNGQKRQDAPTSDMIFPVAELIHYASQYFALSPGDLILTGTPEGVALGMPPESDPWIKPGDEVTVEIDGIGVLRNRFVAG